MSSAFGTELGQLELTTREVGNAAGQMVTHAKQLQAAVDFINRWQGEAADVFRSSMGINTAEVNRLANQAEIMAGNLGQTAQGVMAQESEAARQMNNAQGANAQAAPAQDGGATLASSGLSSPLNFT